MDADEEKKCCPIWYTMCELGGWEKTCHLDHDKSVFSEVLAAEARTFTLCWNIECDNMCNTKVFTLQVQPKLSDY